MAEDFTPARPEGRSMRPYTRSVNHIKTDQFGNVDIGLGDLGDTDGTPDNGDTYIYNSTTNIFEAGPSAGPSQVDLFTITDDATDTFTLSRLPLNDSWNVGMGWPWDEDNEFTISGRTLTVTNPADSFRGIAANGPRTLRVQYDYLQPNSTSVLFKDPCESVASSTALWTGGGCVGIESPGRNGNGGLMVSDTHAFKDLGLDYETLVVGMAIKAAAYTADVDANDYGLATFCTSGGSVVNVTFWLNADTIEVYLGRFTTLLATASAPLDANAWNYVVLSVKVHDTLGEITVVQNGTQVASYTGDTKAGAATGSDSVRIGGFWPVNLLVDDVYINDMSIGDPGDAGLLGLK